MKTIRNLLCLLLTAAILCTLFLPALAAETVSAEAVTQPETVDPPAVVAADTTPQPKETTEPEEITSPFSVPYIPYFGLLHSHTGLSSGKGTAAEAYAYADQTAGLDFLAITDTSHCFDDHLNAAIDRDGSGHSSSWAAGIAAANTATTDDFVALFGYEMSWLGDRQLGHVITFNTPGFQSSQQEPYKEGAKALEEYYKTLTRVPDSLSILCHPSSYYGNFQSFGNYDAAYDDQIYLLEVTDEMGSAWKQYDQALQAGWHVAPSASQNNHEKDWGTVNDDRTVILAEELTKEGLFEAIRSYRVYATQDKDLHLYYTLNGEPMGSTVPSVMDPEIELTVYDPTDSAIGTVEVINENGDVIASRMVSSSYEELSISTFGRCRYYYLRVTQPDGDIAVTAPVWMTDFSDMGISSLKCKTQVPVQGEPAQLELTLFNNEPVELELSTVEILLDGTPVYTNDAPGTVPARKTVTLTIPYTHPEAVSVQLEVVVTGIADGEEQIFSETVDLRFRSSEVVTGMMVDGTHGYENLDALSGAVSLAAAVNMTTTLVTGPMPQGGEILVIPGMNSPADEAFLQDTAQFLEEGGILILWPGSENNGYENALLEALGSTMRFGEAAEADSCTNFNVAPPWCKDLTKEQFFHHSDGFAVETNGATGLVKSSEDHVVLAWDDVGGGIFAAGSAFLQDEAMPLPENVWAVPRANQSIFQKILGTTQTVIKTSDIRDVRRGTVNEVYRIKGYVTAGTSNPNTIFPGTIYLQDDSGGIAVQGYTATDLEIGKPMEIIGVLTMEKGNPVLVIAEYQILSTKSHRYSPNVIPCQNATNYLSYGGELVKIQGKITKRTLTTNKKGIATLTVKDDNGDTATVLIESTILSGSTGKNTLASKMKVGKYVQVTGIVHKNDKGEEVIRVRDCDEVVRIKAPKKADTSNPATGDPFAFLWFLWKWL